MTPTKRRWLQGSLWILVLVVTVLAVAAWLGSNLNWIRQRRAFLAEHEASDEFEMPRDECDAPGFLKFFGETGRRWIFIRVNASDHLTQEELARLRMARRLFPESEVEEIPPDYGLFFERFYPERNEKLKAASRPTE